MTAEDWAPYGIGEPDAEGWYPDYRTPPAHLRPDGVAAGGSTLSDIDGTWLALVTNWRIVVADLSLHHGIDLHDPAVLARPWPGICTMIFSLLDQKTRLRGALTRKD